MNEETFDFDNERYQIHVEYSFEDASFTHAFGTKKAERLVIENLTVFAYVGELPSIADWVDITKSFSTKQLQQFEEWAEKQLEAQGVA